MIELKNMDFPFPIHFCSLEFYSSAVKRPNWVARILMEVLHAYQSSLSYLETALVELGIPLELHGVFSMELQTLVQDGVLLCHGGNVFRSEDFSLCQCKDIQFTEKGNSVYVNNALNDQVPNQYCKEVYYSEVTGELVKIPKNTVAKPLEISIYKGCDLPPLGENAVDFSGVFRSMQQSNKEEEILMDVERVGYEQLVLDMRGVLSLQVKPEGIHFDFATEECDYFVKEHLTPQQLEQYLATRPAFRVKNQSISLLEVTDFTSYGQVKGLHCFNKLDKITVKSSILTVNTSWFPTLEQGFVETGAVIESHLERVLPSVGRLHVHGKGMTAYMAVKIPLRNNLFQENIALPLVCEIALSETWVEKIGEMLEAYGTILPISQNTTEFWVKLSQYREDLALLRAYANSLTQDPKEAVENLLQFSKELPPLPPVEEMREHCCLTYLKEQCTQSKVDTVVADYHRLLPLTHVAGISTLFFIELLLAQRDTSQREQTTQYFTLLTSLGVDTQVLLTHIPMVSHYLSAVLSGEEVERETELGADCYQFQQAWQKVRHLTEEGNSTNPTAFEVAFLDYQRVWKKLESYKVYSITECNELEKYYKQYEVLFEELRHEEEMLQDPYQMDETYIQNQIHKGGYRLAIYDMNVRLQYELQQYYDSDEDTFTLLAQAKEDEVFSPEQLELCHSLRKCRNDYLHPQKLGYTLEKEKVQQWCVGLFALLGELYE